MLRKLLACLALLTGLVAAGAPAQVEATNALAAQLVVSAATPAADNSSIVALRRELPHQPEGALAAAPARGIGPTAHQPTVRLGSDRARE